MEAQRREKKEPNLGNVAMFIAAALHHPNPPCNGPNKWVSTIKVEQHKVKFTDVRIYCSLAHPDLVQAMWNDFHEDGMPAEPTAEFKARCLMDDARYYRHCYISMLELLPEKVAHLVCGAADFRELLCKDLAELDQLINRNVKQSDGGKYPQYLSWLNTRYHVTTVDEVRQCLAKICCFKLE